MSMYFNSTQLKEKNIPPKTFSLFVCTACYLLLYDLVGDSVHKFVEYYTVCKLQ